MSHVAQLKTLKRAIIDGHVKPDNFKGFTQIVTTLLPFALVWYGVVWSANSSYWFTAALLIPMVLLLIRSFVLMHECGHGSLFRSAWLNKTFGFVLGVISGMPQYVWSQHHHFHHSTNGNWSKYRGPLNIVTVADYAAMSASQQRSYRNGRRITLAPLAGFLYVLFNPRFNCLKGSISLLVYLIKSKISQPTISIKEHALGFKTRYWATAPEYWHMLWNNLVLISLWVAMCWWLGPLLFFTCYIISMALAGGAGILLFTVQHNFEHAYASADEGWDYDAAAVDGTSFLVLPAWLNWVTANIAYHHIHHLSARIPNYCLARCHHEYAETFAGVTRITLSQIPSALKNILWDVEASRIISVAEYEQRSLSN